ncbi:hypothetical protein RND81_13G037100 [Saponaria officinalis]|uniref:Dirigent protein n=1 Tax=Saponaria officinalis TaxID=3572 RepID=A0AAW1GZ68_SAPOF
MIIHSNMSNSSKTLHLILITLTTFLHTTPTTSSHHHHNHHDRHHNLKSLHFTLYQHDQINKTDFLIVPSPLGTTITETTSPFGTIGLINDPLTLTKDPNSEMIGNVESIAITSSFDGLDSLSIGRIKLELEDHKGSVSVVGVVNAVVSSDYPVVGGTGDFLFVQGYVTASPVSFEKGGRYVYKQEFHLFWPPYALHA